MMNLDETTKEYLEACGNLGDVTLDDALGRYHSLDGSDIGILIDDFYTGNDMLYVEVGESLEDLIEQLGGQTPIRDVLADR